MAMKKKLTRNQIQPLLTIGVLIVLCIIFSFSIVFSNYSF